MQELDSAAMPRGERSVESGDVNALVSHLTRAGKAGARGERHEQLIAELRTVLEELEVAEDDLPTQHDEIARLLGGSDLAARPHEQTATSLPVAVLVTDRLGTIRAASSAAATLLGEQVSCLLGRPVASLFPVDECQEVRCSAIQQVRDGLPLGQCGLVGRHRCTSVLVEAAATATTVAGADIPVAMTWIVLEEDDEVVPALDRLPAALTRLASLPTTTSDLQSLITAAASVCHQALGPDVEVTVSLGSPDEPCAVASTHLIAQQVDGAQISHGEGPCATAYETRQTVYTPDVRSDARWTGLANDVPPAVRAVIAVPLETEIEVVGALIVYATTGRGIEGLIEAAEMLGATVAAILHEHGLKTDLRRLASDMERALQSRAVIDQAKGLVMAARGCTAEEAFHHLVQLSNARQVKLRDVARELVDRCTDGGFPHGPRPRVRP